MKYSFALHPPSNSKQKIVKQYTKVCKIFDLLTKKVRFLSKGQISIEFVSRPIRWKEIVVNCLAYVNQSETKLYEALQFIACSEKWGDNRSYKYSLLLILLLRG